jgi:4-hydroxythreonine-4-phosphate dehydrogenase
MRPTITLAMGDPAGISPELTAKLLALDDVAAKARLVVIGDRRVLDEGEKVRPPPPFRAGESHPEAVFPK